MSSRAQYPFRAFVLAYCLTMRNSCIHGSVPNAGLRLDPSPPGAPLTARVEPAPRVPQQHYLPLGVRALLPRRRSRSPRWADSRARRQGRPRTLHRRSPAVARVHSSGDSRRHRALARRLARSNSDRRPREQDGLQPTPHRALALGRHRAEAPEWLALVEASSLRLLDFVSAFFDPANLPSRDGRVAAPSGGAVTRPTSDRRVTSSCARSSSPTTCAPARRRRVPRASRGSLRARGRHCTRASSKPRGQIRWQGEKWVPGRRRRGRHAEGRGQGARSQGALAEARGRARGERRRRHLRLQPLFDLEARPREGQGDPLALLPRAPRARCELKPNDHVARSSRRNSSV